MAGGGRVRVDRRFVQLRELPADHAGQAVTFIRDLDAPAYVSDQRHAEEFLLLLSAV